MKQKLDLVNNLYVTLLHMQGSTVEREASEKERAKVSPTLKDVDFVNSGAALYIGENDRTKLMSVLTSDTQVCGCDSQLYCLQYSGVWV